MRADQLLVHRGLAASRSQAARLIDAGARYLHQSEWRPLRKSDILIEDAQIDLTNVSEAKYVSRGGLKLEGALAACKLNVKDKVCLDVGQSTGGFTDCLLQHGASGVVGIDVGQGQLHPRLRASDQVVCIEKLNARTLIATDLIAGSAAFNWSNGIFDRKNELDFGVSLVVGDVSFISQTLIIEAVADTLKTGGDWLMLVKPQFELQPQQIGKGGIVKDVVHYAQVEQRIRAAYKDHGLQVKNYFESPITGGDGNREFFVHAVKT